MQGSCQGCVKVDEVCGRFGPQQGGGGGSGGCGGHGRFCSPPVHRSYVLGLTSNAYSVTSPRHTSGSFGARSDLFAPDWARALGWVFLARFSSAGTLVRFPAFPLHLPPPSSYPSTSGRAAPISYAPPLPYIPRRPSTPSLRRPAASHVVPSFCPVPSASTDTRPRSLLPLSAGAVMASSWDHWRT